MIDHGELTLGPLSRALLEEIAEGVVVFDEAGRIVYANGAARMAMRKAGIERGPRSMVLPQLSRLGSRLAPIWIGGAKLGEAVFVPLSAATSSGQQTLADREREAILETLKATNWKLTESARVLGISRTTLWRRLRTYGIDRDKRAQWSEPS
jgi:transcriptional regulator with PAS, ATPase and Fis domain